MPAYALRNLKDPSRKVPGRFAIDAERLDEGAIGTVFSAPWRSIELIRLDPGQALGPRTLDDSEVLLFVTAGSALVHAAGIDIPLERFHSATFLRGETLHVEPRGELRLETFVAEIGVRAPTDGGS